MKNLIKSMMPNGITGLERVNSALNCSDFMRAVGDRQMSEYGAFGGAILNGETGVL
jgi:hypothetical protein